MEFGGGNEAVCLQKLDFRKPFSFCVGLSEHSLGKPAVMEKADAPGSAIQSGGLSRHVCGAEPLVHIQPQALSLQPHELAQGSPVQLSSISGHDCERRMDH